MKQSLNSALQNHYQAKQLNSDQLQQLQQMQMAAQGSKTRNAPRWVAATSVCVAIILAWQLFFTSSELARPQQIADEVVYNHLNLKPLEITGANFSDISQYFSKLPFRPITSERVSSRGLAGARYCSIKTIPAAQYRLYDSSGRAETWYQVAYDASTFGEIPNSELGEQPLVRYSKGVGVKIWREKGVLFALTVSHQ